MDSMLVAAGSAFWFGILTSISPCPLATNIAAVSYIGKHMESRRKMVLSGLLYTGGRVAVYVGLSFVLVLGLLSIPQAALFLQKYINMLIGPLLMVVGVVLLGIFPIWMPDLIPKQKFGFLVEKGNIAGAGLLGIVFALSFCPVSAALFFGSLIPISVKYHSSIWLPTLYGIGTGLPVLVFALTLGVAIQHVGRVFDNIARFEYWARRVTGVLFIAIGVYYSVEYLFEPSI